MLDLEESATFSFLSGPIWTHLLISFQSPGLLSPCVKKFTGRRRRAKDAYPPCTALVVHWTAS
jgi:hypothetical protein